MEKGSLYLKYRPSSFEEMYGNKSVVEAAQKLIKQDVHVYMLTGNAGCGKTTLARIMARACGANDMSIKELNAGAERGIDAGRDIAEFSRFRPIDGSNLAFIIDEAHNMTSAMQQSLLKPLEDTPPHAYFFLCTTAPEKITKAIHTRCSVLQLQPLSEKTMGRMLSDISEKEDYALDDEVKEAIIDAADGSSRLALKLLDSVLSIEDPEKALKVLDKTSLDAGGQSAECIDLCRMLSKGASWDTLAALLSALKNDDAERIRQAVMGYMRAILLKGGKLNPNVVAAMQCFSQADTFRNGFNALVVACLDYLNYGE